MFIPHGFRMYEDGTIAEHFYLPRIMMKLSSEIGVIIFNNWHKYAISIALVLVNDLLYEGDLFIL